MLGRRNRHKTKLFHLSAPESQRHVISRDRGNARGQGVAGRDGRGRRMGSWIEGGRERVEAEHSREKAGRRARSATAAGYSLMCESFIFHLPPAVRCLTNTGWRPRIITARTPELSAP